MVLYPAAEDTGLQSFPKLILVLLLEGVCDLPGVIPEECVDIVPLLVDECLDTEDILKHQLHE